tara:strand:- start:677 stop:1066 length:390 start_codon:yes stop_codon:yes gene_type:complete
MCMGGGSRATITKPDYNAYNKQFELQKAAIESSMDSSTRLMQGEFQSALQDQQTLRQEILDDRMLAVENANEEARRLTTLIGTPPPEANAQAPDIGARERGINTRKGKSSLRIGRSATSSARGTGLNIT